MFENFPRFLTGGHGLDLHMLQIDACKECPVRWPNHNHANYSLAIMQTDCDLQLAIICFTTFTMIENYSGLATVARPGTTRLQTFLWSQLR